MTTQTDTPTPATRVTVDEMQERMRRGEAFTFLDTRNPQAWNNAQSKLPGAMRVPVVQLEQALGSIQRDRAVITYCT